MALALFDLDNTLLNGDSDHAWGIFLAQLGVVDAHEQELKQDYFYQQYQHGTLNIDEFLAFQLKPLTQHSITQLHRWREQFLEDVIKPMISSGKPHLLEPHRAAGDKIVIITATNDFITRPIADLLGVETLLATQAEQLAGKYTGKHHGTPCYQSGKVTVLQNWLRETPHPLAGSLFYSDSINDLPLLELVDTPIVVTPDAQLRAHAEKFHWKIID